MAQSARSRLGSGLASLVGRRNDTPNAVALPALGSPARDAGGAGEEKTGVDEGAAEITQDATGDEGQRFLAQRAPQTAPAPANRTRGAPRGQERAGPPETGGRIEEERKGKGTVRVARNGPDRPRRRQSRAEERGQEWAKGQEWATRKTAARLRRGQEWAGLPLMGGGTKKQSGSAALRA